MAELIAEIGGSSSRWALLDTSGGATVLPFAGEGMPGYNPLSGDAAAFAKGITEYFHHRLPIALSATRIAVYGAGCGTPERAAAMDSAIRQVWPAASIVVRTDLEGAALGLCGKDPGLVLILGTGSNAGWYDGAALHLSFPSLGYVIGDEGSGADIGRTILQDAFYHRMPEDARIALFGAHGPDLSTVLNEVYRSPFPSRSLAAYAGKLTSIAESPYAHELIASRFTAFIEAFKPFHPAEQRARVFATGSIAYAWQELLANCLFDHGMELVKAERDPLNGLIRWHQPAALQGGGS
jgi:N-acetylglucosamine kinase-like BadF-type ATPase